VLGVIEKRLGAKLVADYLEDLTPSEEYELLRMTAAQKALRRDRGTGRPTKRDRREIERLFGDE
jgi:ribosome-associated heat shock protein Hsp15